MTLPNSFLFWVTQKVSLAAGKIVPRVVVTKIETLVFKYTTNRIKKQVVIRGKTNSPLVFCIVHWNAPHYLLLNIRQIQLLYPQSNIYILDNGSEKVNLDAAKRGLEKFNNVTLFAAKLQTGNLVTRLIESLFNSYTHSKGLHFLLNYSAEHSNEIAVFLDQDCILSNNIDYLLAKFGKDVVLIGPRDLLLSPKDYGPLTKGILRNYGMFVHASFMILQPKRLKPLLGDFSFQTQNHFREPYHNISFRTQGKIFFLDTQMHETIPYLTRYVHQNITYAWHAWYSRYSSRIDWLDPQSKLENYPVSWLQEVRKLAFDYLSQIGINDESQMTPSQPVELATSLGHIFISHVEEDAKIVEEIAKNLESKGFATWYYERDLIPGQSYKLTTRKTIEQSEIAILIISNKSLRSNQIHKEVVTIHEAGIHFIPILNGITYKKFLQSRPEWRRPLGSSSSISIPKEGVQAMIPLLISCLVSLGIQKKSDVWQQPEK
jgi:TIR domain